MTLGTNELRLNKTGYPSFRAPPFQHGPGTSTPPYTAIPPATHTVSPDPSITALDRHPSFQHTTKTNMLDACPNNNPLTR